MANAFIGSEAFALYKIKRSFMFFTQFTFAINASVMWHGGVAGRMRFGAYLWTTAAMATFVYPVCAHWVWSPSGWLNNIGESGIIEFSGGGPVHILAGVTALVGTKIIGPRLQTEERGLGKFAIAHNKPLAASGTFMMLIGWIGYTTVTAGTVSPYYQAETAGRVATCTLLAASSAAIVSFAGRRLLARNYDLISLSNSMMAGLVSITSPCACIDTWASVIIGGVGSALQAGVSELLRRLGVDDPMDSIAVHLAGGIWGSLSAGLFANPQYLADSKGLDPSAIRAFGLLYGGSALCIGQQLLGIVAIIAWAAITMTIVFSLLKYFGILRISKEAELGGVDLFKLGGVAYPDFALGSTSNERLQLDMLADPKPGSRGKRTRYNSNNGGRGGKHLSADGTTGLDMLPDGDGNLHSFNTLRRRMASSSIEQPFACQETVARLPNGGLDDKPARSPDTDDNSFEHQPVDASKAWLARPTQAAPRPTLGQAGDAQPPPSHAAVQQGDGGVGVEEVITGLPIDTDGEDDSGAQQRQQQQQRVLGSNPADSGQQNEVNGNAALARGMPHAAGDAGRLLDGDDDHGDADLRCAALSPRDAGYYGVDGLRAPQSDGSEHSDSDSYPYSSVSVAMERQAARAAQLQLQQQAQKRNGGGRPQGRARAPVASPYSPQPPHMYAAHPIRWQPMGPPQMYYDEGPYYGRYPPVDPSVAYHHGRGPQPMYGYPVAPVRPFGHHDDLPAREQLQRSRGARGADFAQQPPVPGWAAAASPGGKPAARQFYAPSPASASARAPAPVAAPPPAVASRALASDGGADQSQSGSKGSHQSDARPLKTTDVIPAAHTAIAVTGPAVVEASMSDAAQHSPAEVTGLSFDDSAASSAKVSAAPEQ